MKPLVLTSLLTLTPLLAAQTAPKVTSVSLFKNGYAVVYRESAVPAGGVVEIAPPVASLGSFWIGASPGVKIEGAVVTTVTKTGERNVASLDELLAANVGQTLLFETNPAYQGQNLHINGKLLSADGPFVIVAGEGNVNAMFFKSAIVRVAAPGGELKYKQPTTSTDRLMRIRAAGRGNVFTLALQRGLTWAPGYRLDISDEDKLTLTSKATLMNDLDDLDGIEVRLITGFPNVRFLGMLDPFTSGATVDQFVQSLLGTGAATMGAPGGALTQNAGRLMERNEEGDAFFQPFEPSDLGGFQAEDLFFYRLGGVSLKRGDRGYYVLFQAESPYEHLYTFDLPDRTEQYQRTSEGAVQDPNPEAWHVIQFKNTANQPLTTAAVTTMKGGEILGQDMLDYTPAGADAEVRVTKALDIQAKAQEELLGRERGFVKNRHGDPLLDRITVRGTIEVVNRKAREVKARVTKSSRGEVVETTGDPKVTRSPASLNDPNAAVRYVWTVPLKPAERRTLSFTYTLLVPTMG